MQYTTNYNLSKPDSDDIINPNSRTGYNGNFDTIDTNLKSVSNKADTNESNIADLQTKTGEDIPFESGSADSISDKITNLDNSVGTKPSGETDTLWEKIDTLFNPIPVTVSSSLQTPTVNAYQIGKMVYGCIEFPRVAMTVHSWIEIGTISQSPTANIQVPSVNTANGNFAGIVQIRADGIIRVYPSESASQGALSFTFSYTI